MKERGVEAERTEYGTGDLDDLYAHYLPVPVPGPAVALLHDSYPIWPDEYLGELRRFLDKRREECLS